MLKNETNSGKHSLIWSMVIGMIIGFIAMLTFGISIDKISLGIATAPAVGAAIGFLIYGIINRNKEEYIEQSNKPKRSTVLFSVLIAGFVLCLLIALYLVF